MAHEHVKHDGSAKRRREASELSAVVMPIGMKKTPIGWPLMANAFLDFAMFSIGQSDCLEAFENDTGVKFSPPSNAFEELIDTATGHTRSVISEFLDWLVVNHWGEA